MDNTPSGTGTRRQDGDPPQSHSPPNVMSNSTDISQSGFHRVTTGPTLQGRPSYATMARTTLSDERPDSSAGASPATAPRRRETRPPDNQTTAHPSTASRSRQATAEQFNAELDARSRAGKVSASILGQTSARNPHQWSSGTASSRCRQHAKRFCVYRIFFKVIWHI